MKNYYGPLDLGRLLGCVASMMTSFTQAQTQSILILIQVDSNNSQKVIGVCILLLSTIVLLDFGTVPTVWYFFVFHFINSILN
jgi:sugar phosphate permease